MLDKRSDLLLKKIFELCSDGGYKILSIDEFMPIFQKKLAVTEDSLKDIFSYLKEREYISIKYFNGKDYCLCPLPKGRLVIENIETIKTTEKKDMKKFFTIMFLGGMLGAFLGSLLSDGIVLIFKSIFKA